MKRLDCLNLFRQLAVCLGLAAVLGLAGCAAPPATPKAVEPPWRDALFAPPSVPISADAVLALDGPMRDYLDRHIRPQVRAKGGRRALIDALYTQGELKLSYDSTTTRSASEAFAARRGNCLSLVIMTAAFAKELGLDLRFQNVPTQADVERAADMVLYIGHVNLALGGQRPGASGTAHDVGWLTIDFLPGQDLRGQRSEPIDSRRVLAMYMNNKAAEALVAGRLDDAYAWTRAALAQDLTFSAAHNTLAVVYRRRGAVAEAEQVLQQALLRDPEHPHLLGNLVGLLADQGRSAQAGPLRDRLARLQPAEPMSGLAQGLQALRAGDWRLARDLLEAEARRTPGQHALHFWLAQACWQLGDIDASRRHLQAARDAAGSGEQRALYAGKLDRLRALQLQ